MAQNNEASVEEILESIKKVIARDNRSDAAAMRVRRAEASEPTEIEPVTDEEASEVLDLAEMDLAEEEPVSQDDTEEPESLIADEVRSAMQENLAALAMLSDPPAKPQIVRSGETSLEGLTRELLRPMLAEWLDKNLPGMVESMVQAEIARIAGKRR
ncbi:MAG: DUF2497 domain-containing protein [Pseudomonadota bacterium]|nr:DUF2497 domain-containing protein [Pseudomonadota bacterium]